MIWLFIGLASWGMIWLFIGLASWGMYRSCVRRDRWQMVCLEAGMSSEASRDEVLERIREMKEAHCKAIRDARYDEIERLQDGKSFPSGLQSNYWETGNRGIGGHVLRPSSESED